MRGIDSFCHVLPGMGARYVDESCIDQGRISVRFRYLSCFVTVTMNVRGLNADYKNTRREAIGKKT